MADPSDPEAGGAGLRRRDLLAGAVGGVAGGLVGGGLGLGAGYRYRDDVEGLRADIQRGRVSGLRQFRDEADRLIALQARQTGEEARALRARFDRERGPATPVWTLVERLALVVDPTDRMLYAGSQLLHVRQTLAAMEARGVDDPDMHLIAILHDLGKIVVLDGVPPEHVMGWARVVGDAEPGAGLDAVPLQTGHWDIVWQRVVGRVPEPVAWTVRYHNVHVEEVRPFMNEREREWSERYLVPFQRLEVALRSPFNDPPIDLAPYRVLIERIFPEPIAF